MVCLSFVFYRFRPLTRKTELGRLNIIIVCFMRMIYRARPLSVVDNNAELVNVAPITVNRNPRHPP